MKVISVCQNNMGKTILLIQPEKPAFKNQRTTFGKEVFQVDHLIYARLPNIAKRFFLKACLSVYSTFGLVLGIFPENSAAVPKTD